MSANILLVYGATFHRISPLHQSQTLLLHQYTLPN